jgi:hypothetical protein
MADLSSNPMHFAGVSVLGNTTATTISIAGTAVQYTHFNTNDPSRGAVPDHTEDHITINREGTYQIVASITVKSVAGSASQIGLDIQKNNGASSISNIHAHRNLAGGGGDRGSMSLSGIATLAKDDTIELWVTNETNTDNYTLEDVTLSVIQLS